MQRLPVLEKKGSHRIEGRTSDVDACSIVALVVMRELIGVDDPSPLWIVQAEKRVVPKRGA